MGGPGRLRGCKQVEGGTTEREGDCCSSLNTAQQLMPRLLKSLGVAFTVPLSMNAPRLWWELGILCGSVFKWVSIVG